MNIYEALKSKSEDIRLTNDAENRWLVWDIGIGQWTVWQRKRYERQSGCLYHGNSVDDAVEILLRH